MEPRRPPERIGREKPGLQDTHRKRPRAESKER
jgi:hypothetical protein